MNDHRITTSELFNSYEQDFVNLHKNFVDKLVSMAKEARGRGSKNLNLNSAANSDNQIKEV